MKKVVWFVFFSIVTVSCLNEPDCYQLNNNLIVVYFKVLGFGIDVVSLNNVHSDASLPGYFYGDTTITQIPLPLNPIEEETNFTFEQKVLGSSNLDLEYTRQVQFVSPECGERYVFKDLKIMQTDFDSVRVVNSVPTRPASINIEIFRCAVTNQMGLGFGTATHIEGVTADFSSDISVPAGNYTRIDLPVNTDESTTTFIINFGDVSKTLRVKYTRTSKTFAKICGPQTLFSDLTIDSTGFTTATVVSKKLEDNPIRNIEATK